MFWFKLVMAATVGIFWYAKFGPVVGGGMALAALALPLGSHGDPHGLH